MNEAFQQNPTKNFRSIGILGGTFDPVHHGHIHLLKYLIHENIVNEAWMIPTATPPHKEADHITPMSLRIHMIQLAIRNAPLIKLELIESRPREAPYYTYDTLCTLQAQHPNSHFRFILGWDQACQIHTWKDYRKLLDSFNLLVLKRQTEVLTQNVMPEDVFIKMQHCLIENPLMHISATEIRSLVSKRSSKVKEYLDNDVYAFILKKGLYQK